MYAYAIHHEMTSARQQLVNIVKPTYLVVHILRFQAVNLINIIVGAVLIRLTCIPSIIFYAGISYRALYPYNSISWMLYISFLRHSPRYFPDGNLVCVYM